MQVVPAFSKMIHDRKRDAVSRTDARWIKRGTSVTSACTSRSPKARATKGFFRERAGGQTLVEFALITPVFLLLMLGVVQMVVVGGAALAVNQAAIACARYASLNPSAAQSSVGTYLTANASPLISDSGLQPVVVSPVAVPRTTGSAVTVTVSYKLATKLFLGTTFFGVTFPSQLSITETMTSE
jgi:Flp pilus assembly protein TadG